MSLVRSLIAWRTVRLGILVSTSPLLICLVWVPIGILHVTGLLISKLLGRVYLVHVWAGNNNMCIGLTELTGLKRTYLFLEAICLIYLILCPHISIHFW